MGRHKHDRSESPIKGSGSPLRRSPSRRERSPLRRSTQGEHIREKPYSRIKSSRHQRSRSPASPSPVREKQLSRTKSSSHARSRSPVPRCLVKDKPLARTMSSEPSKSRSPVSRSPSPRTKRLRKVQAERESDRVSERGYEKSHGRGSDRASHRERDSDHSVPSEKREKRQQRDANGFSRPKPPRSISPSDHHHRSRHRSRSPTAADRRARDEVTRSRGAEHRNGDSDALAKMQAAEEALDAKEKQKPSFELSGKLAAETNRVKGVTLLFTEPPEARKPEIRWRLYVFKGGEVLNEPLYIHRQTCYLFGRERRVADIPTDHPSCSKQHAVLQYRQVEKEQPDGTSIKQVRPYIMDLGSTNGTFINDNRLEPQRYYELVEQDTVKFGNSSREYVLLHENSAG